MDEKDVVVNLPEESEISESVGTEDEKEDIKSDCLWFGWTREHKVKLFVVAYVIQLVVVLTLLSLAFKKSNRINKKVNEVENKVKTIEAIIHHIVKATNSS
mmetsp:Transcript_16347/g.19864  ORF Transcript_16347/g.19864 Transcript_16347/m.19864 type:complete len:101 (+) Transcript_16347:177-479(+)